MASISQQNLAESAVHARIRDLLNAEGIKLWLEPFYDEAQAKTSDSEILALASRYSTELELPEADVTECMYSLQRNAIERLAERHTYQSTGLATIRLRFSGFSPDRINLQNVTNKLQINLTQITGKQLKESVAELISVSNNGLKLICAGRVVDENETLESQHVKNGTQIMVLSVATDHETLQQVEDQFKELEETKNSADFLSTKDGTDGYSLQVADQSGKPLNLPDSEKKALTVALALHEKGRAFMKSQQFSKSLVFLLEADTVYGQCQSSILEMVDNYGLLNLDVAWCYLSLQSISELPQVEARLKKCEVALNRSYGADMERVIALKGSSGWEAALYVRLHLLQAIAGYHLGQIEKSKFYLDRAESELGRLRVSDDSLVALISMGYGEEESRMALRSNYGDMTAAVDWIIRKRDETAQIKQQEKEDLKTRKLQKKLGKCVNGDPVNVHLFRQLKAMGYSSFLISEALQRTDNDANAAVNLMGDQAFESQILTKLVNDFSSQPSSSTSNPVPNALASAMANVAELAASLPQEASSQAALSNVLDAMSNDPGAISAAVNSIREALNQSFSEDSLLSSTTPSEEEIKKSRKAYDTLAKDIYSEAEYIDLSLTAENAYLDQYKVLLASL